MLTMRLVAQVIGCARASGHPSKKDKTTRLREAALEADGGTCAS